MAKTTASRKAKGRNLQNKVRDLVLENYKELEEDDVRSAPMGVNGADIQLSPKAKKLFPYSVECKNSERLNVYKAWEQTVSNVDKDTQPLLVIKKNRKQPLVIMDLDYFMELVCSKQV